MNAVHDAKCRSRVAENWPWSGVNRAAKCNDRSVALPSQKPDTPAVF